MLILTDLLKMEKGIYSLSPSSRDFLVANAPANLLWEIKKYSGSAGPFDNLSEALAGEVREFSPDILKKVNRSLKPGGLFVSHHLSRAESREDRLSMSLVELMTRVMGYPIHQLPVEALESALKETGFGRFTVTDTGRQTAFPTTLVGARKLQKL